jgi:DNA-binding GntR family transcriptional regulator
MASQAHYVEESFEQHKEILRAIEERRQKLALRLLAEHVRRSGYILAKVSQP